MKPVAVDQNLSRPGPAVVIRRQHKTVRSGTENCKWFAPRNAGEGPVLSEKIPGFTERADDIDSLMPPIGEMGSRDTFKTTRVLDRNGDLLYEILDQAGGKRTPIRLSELPPHLINAVLAAPIR